VDLTFQPVGPDVGFRKFVSKEYDYAALNDDLTEEQYANYTDFQMFPAFALCVSCSTGCKKTGLI